MMFYAVFAVTLFLSGTNALTCIDCKGEGSSCSEKANSTVCDTPPQGQGAVCGKITFKVNGTKKVENRCALKSLCVGPIDCYKEGFEFGKGKVGYSNCVVTCCNKNKCEPKPLQKCYQCKGNGATCSSKSVSCSTSDDRCLRVNFKVNGKSMVDERCYQSSQCSNTTTTCNLIKADYLNTTVTECKPMCCEGDLCNGVGKPKTTPNPNAGSSPFYYAPLMFLAFLLQML